MSRYHLAIDLGSKQSKILVGSLEESGWRVITSYSFPSVGIKHGEIKDVNLVAERIDNALAEVENSLKAKAFRKAAVGVVSPSLEVHSSKGVIVVARPDQEITEEDKERADKGALAFPLPPNRTLVQFIPSFYTIDGSNKVKDPVGIKGLRLESEALLLDVFSPVIRALNQVGNMVRLDFSPKIVLPYAGAEIALSDKDKDLGAIALDLGAGVTSYSVYEDGQLLDMKVFPVGGNSITNDITIGLKIPVEVAEEIKITEGMAWAKKVPKGECFDLSDYWEEAEKDTQIKKKFLAEIIEARVLEIFDLVIQRLKQIERFSKLPGGVVLYGGGAKLPLIKELAREKFKLPVRIAKIDNEWYRENPDPAFVPVLGLLQKSLESEEVLGLNNSLGGSITKFFRKLFSW